MRYNQDILNWRDLQIALALVTHQDMALAARRLQISTSTLQRRVKALEKSLDTVLFERSSRGTQCTERGLAALKEALPMRAHARTFLRTLEQDYSSAGTISITLPSGFVAPFCAHLPHVHARHPDIDIRIIESNDFLDLSKDDLDLAIRVTHQPQGELWGRKLGMIHFAPHASRDYANTYVGQPAAQHPWVVMDVLQETSPQSKWESSFIDPAQIALRTSSRAAFLGSLRASVGSGIMATLKGAQYDDLVQIAPHIPELSLELWLLAHQSQRHHARLLAMMDTVYALAHAQLGKLSKRIQLHGMAQDEP